MEDRNNVEISVAEIIYQDGNATDASFHNKQ